MRRHNDNSDRTREDASRGVTRRGFLTSMGAGAVSVAAAGSVSAERAAKTNVIAVDEKVQITLRVNGRFHELLVEPRWSLSYVLREELHLTGTKVGCDRGECGACTVLINEVPRYSCLTLAVEAEGAEIVTIEGLMDGEELGPVQQAFVEEDAMQCGYCVPGQIMAAEGLLRVNPDPSLDEIRSRLSGNLCRCGAYTHIHTAVRRAADLKRSGGGAS